MQVAALLQVEFKFPLLFNHVWRCGRFMPAICIHANFGRQVAECQGCWRVSFRPGALHLLFAKKGE